ncbi:hypothetical protein ACIQVA_36140 [Streptomyces microflavus]|uniref:hypothetical protein n=1 Tax=Streptomyces microflavus TaxID=1919 RepID=UPI0037FE0471
MDLKGLGPVKLKRIPERDVSLKSMRFLALIDVNAAALEERWGVPEKPSDDLAEWVCFAFSLTETEAFFLQREASCPPTQGFILSVTGGLFSESSAGQIAEALEIEGAQVTQVNAEAAQ